MFDHVNMCVYDPIRANEIINENYYKFKVVVDQETGETLRSYAKYGNMNFIIYPHGRIVITGSLHKFSNFLVLGKSHNSNRLTLSQLQKVSNFFTNKLKINISDLEIHSIEFGFNLELDYPPPVVLNNVKYFKDHLFYQKQFDTPGILKECFMSEYDIKVYDKGMQVKSTKNIIRIEKRIKRMRAVFAKKTYFANLLEIQTWDHCRINFLDTLKLIVFNDQFTISGLPMTSRKIIKIFDKSQDWIGITKQRRNKTKLQIEKIIEKYGKLKIKHMLLSLTGREFERCIN